MLTSIDKWQLFAPRYGKRMVEDYTIGFAVVVRLDDNAVMIHTIYLDVVTRDDDPLSASEMLAGLGPVLGAYSGTWEPGTRTCRIEAIYGPNGLIIDTLEKTIYGLPQLLTAAREYHEYLTVHAEPETETV